MVYVKSRLDAEVRTTWVCNGGDVASDSMVENMPMERLVRLTLYHSPTYGVADLAVAIDALPLPRSRWAKIDMQVERETQRKEIVLMLAMRAAGRKVVFTPGNQTAVDCYVHIADSSSL